MQVLPRTICAFPTLPSSPSRKMPMDITLWSTEESTKHRMSITTGTRCVLCVYPLDQRASWCQEPTHVQQNGTWSTLDTSWPVVATIQLGRNSSVLTHRWRLDLEVMLTSLPMNCGTLQRCVAAYRVRRMRTGRWCYVQCARSRILTLTFF